MCTGTDRSMEEIPRQRVENNINALPLCFTIDAIHKARVSRVENALSRDVKGINKVLDLFFATDCCINLRSYHASNMDRCDTNPATGGVDENGLLKDLAPLSDQTELGPTYLTGFQPCQIQQAMDNRAVHARNCRCFFE